MTLLALWTWNNNKDKDWYKNLPPPYKYSNIYFEVPGGVIRLPIPFELGVIFMSLPQAIADSYRDQNIKWLSGVYDIAKSQIPDIIPSALGPLYDVSRNKNYLGIPIESEGMQYLYPTERKKNYTSSFAIAMSKAFNSANLAVSPIQIDYLLDSYSGGFLNQFRIRGDELASLPVLSDIMVRGASLPKRQLNEFFSDYERLTQREQSGLATREEKRELNKIKPFYNYYKNTNKLIKNAQAKKDQGRVDQLYGQMQERLERYGYN